MSETDNLQIELKPYSEVTLNAEYGLDRIIFDLDSQIDLLSSKADNFDCLVSVASGVLCGLLDVLWVGEFSLEHGRGIASDKIDGLVTKTAKMLGCKNDDLESAVKFLEKKFPIPVSYTHLDVYKRQDDKESRFTDHVDQFYGCFCERIALGNPPRDLAHVLAKTALASPAVVALRSLMRLYPAEVHGEIGEHLMTAAAQIALGFRSMFNLPESIALIQGEKGGDETSYWESVLDYCCEGNLQAVMDEYVHILRDDLGLLGQKNPAEDLMNIAGEIRTALSIRTVSLGLDELKTVEPEDVKLVRSSMRCLYALRFGQEQEDEQDEKKNRPDQVRRAFNSPCLCRTGKSFWVRQCSQNPTHP